MQASEHTNEISAALAKAQGEIVNPSKESENPHFRSNYADLSSGINALRAALSKNGIAYVQGTRLDGDILMLDTLLTHSSGQWFGGEFPVCKFPERPQIVGSALTYARRYSLFAIAGIAGEDDDGNEANKSETPMKRPAPPPPPAIQALDADGSRAARDIMLNIIADLDTPGKVREFIIKNSIAADRLHEADLQIVRDAIEDKKAELGRVASYEH